MTKTEFRPSSGLRIAVALAVAGMVADVSAQQDVGGDRRLALEEVVVTGEKREKSLQETYASVGLMTEKDLDSANFVEMTDIYSQLPNVAPAVANLGVSIRGIGATPAQGVTALNTVILDGATINPRVAALATRSTWDLSQIEVFRGPQSTNIGRAALGGAIVLKSADPSFEWGGKVRLRAGENGTGQFAGALTGPLVEDELSFRASIDRRETDGFVTNSLLEDDEAGFNETTSARFKLLWTPEVVTDFSAALALNYVDNESGENNIFYAPGTDPEDAITNVNIPQVVETENFVAALQLEKGLGENWDFKSITTYSDMDYSITFDFDGTPGGGDRPAFREEPAETTTQEFRLAYTEGAFRALGGVYYNDTSNEEVFGGTIAFFNACCGIPDPFTLLFIQPEESENYAVFGEVEFAVGERWDIMIGGRYDREDQRRTRAQQATGDESLTPPFNTFFPDTSETTDITYDAFLPKGSATYNLNEDRSLTFLVSRGYRAGDANINIVTGQVSEADPEFVMNYELAWRSLWMDGRLRWNANLFYMDWEDQQVFVAGGSGVSGDNNLQNAGSSTLYGFETEFTGQLTPEWDFFVNAGYLQAEYDSFRDDQTGQDFSGNDIPDAPEWSFAAGVGYRNAQGWFFDLNGSYNDDRFSTFNNANNPQDVVDSYVLFNGQLGYGRDNWDIALYARNLFDEDYFLDLQRTIGTVAIGPERIVGLRLDYRLGEAR